MKYLNKTSSVLVIFIVIALLSTSAWGLPPKLEAKKNWLGVEKALEKDDYAKAIEFLEKMKNLGVELQPEYYFQYGRSLIKSGQSAKGLEFLNTYIEKAGEEGEYVEWALELMNEGEAKVEVERKKAEELEKERQQKAEAERKLQEEKAQKEAARKEWERKRQEAKAKKQMEKERKNAFAKLVLDDSKERASPALRIQAWKDFLEKYPDDNPNLQEANERKQFWQHVAAGPYQGEVPQSMALVPAGAFQMGSKYGKAKTKPQHMVLLDRFFIDRYEVTQAEYEKVMGSNPSGFKGANRPVDNVTWNDAVVYCNKVGKRLPTEAEWERAARGGTTTSFYWGDGWGDTEDYAWSSENSGGLFSSDQTHPVGQKKPNAYGLYDMLGNVWEWVADNYDLYNANPQFNPTGPTSGSKKVIRGGSWYNDPEYVSSVHRSDSKKEDVSTSVGFRCAKSVPETQGQQPIVVDNNAPQGSTPQSRYSIKVNQTKETVRALNALNVERDFAKLLEQDKLNTVSPQAKAEAWEGFIKKYPDNNPYLDQAREKVKKWKASGVIRKLF